MVGRQTQRGTQKEDARDRGGDNNGSKLYAYEYDNGLS